MNDYYNERTGRILLVQASNDLGINSRNYFLKAARGDFVLKRLTFSAESSPRSLQTRLFIAGDLRYKNAFFPRIFSTSKGDLLLKKGNEAWCLLEFISGKHFDGRLATFYHVGQSVGRLFVVLKNYPKKTYLPKLGKRGIRTFFQDESLKTFNRLLLDCEKGKGRRFKDALGREIIRYWPSLKKSFSIAQRDWQTIKKFPPQLCHIDLHPHNILVSHNRLAAFLDFDSLRYCQPVISLGYGLFKLMKNVVILNKLTGKQNKIKEIARRFARSYIHAGAISIQEAKYLMSGARIENVQRFLNVAERYYEGDTRWGRFIPVFGNALAGELDCVF